jgi:hypothetical protein
MNLDDLKNAWKCQDESSYSDICPDDLLKRLRTTQKDESFVTVFADLIVAAILLSCTAYFIFSNSDMEIVWPLYTGSALILGAAAFSPWRNRLRRKREKRYGDSLRDELQKRSEQLDDKIRFSRWSAMWSYYLPIITGLSLLYWQFHLNGRISLDQFHRAVVLKIVLLGLLGYFAGGLGLAAARKEKEEVDAKLAALDFAVTNESIPVANRMARMLLVASITTLCGYLLYAILNPAPRTGSPVEPAAAGRSARFAKVAPFTGVRWEVGHEQPLVQIRGQWFRLTTIDGIPVEQLMQTARENFGDKAHKRFAEDLPELLAAAGHQPGWKVTLMLDRGDGNGPVPFTEEMTEAKRQEARDTSSESPK